MSTTSSLSTVLAQIEQLAEEWHGAGTLGCRPLRAIARLVGPRELRRSAETGAGKSTLLLSHLSAHHVAFALDHGGSVSKTRSSPLLRPGCVTFVEGPTQRTLAGHRFEQPLELALIDGPHGYPFPELEYYALYPHLAPGALLIVDDIHIPTVHHLFAFLREDQMFELLEVVDTTAFFRRTAAPTFDPEGDRWWEQRYNAARYPAHRAGSLWRRGVRALRRLLGEG